MLNKYGVKKVFVVSTIVLFTVLTELFNESLASIENPYNHG